MRGCDETMMLRFIQLPQLHSRHFFLAESVLVADPEQGVSRTEGRLSRGESKEFAPTILAVTWLQGRTCAPSGTPILLVKIRL